MNICGCIISAHNDKFMVEKAIKELKEGVALLAQHQKFITNADQYKCCWQTIAAYRSKRIKRMSSNWRKQRGWQSNKPARSAGKQQHPSLLQKTTH